MPKYALEIKQSAQKELDALGDPPFARIDRKILAPADNPRPAGCKKLKGYRDQWRVRAGDWRVVYIINDTAKLVKTSSASTPIICHMAQPVGVVVSSEHASVAREHGDPRHHPRDEDQPLHFRQFLEQTPGEQVVLVDDILRTGSKLHEMKELPESRGATDRLVSRNTHAPLTLPGTLSTDVRQRVDIAGFQRLFSRHPSRRVIHLRGECMSTYRRAVGKFFDARTSYEEEPGTHHPHVARVLGACRR